MWKQSNTKTLVSQCGMWEVKIKSVHYGGIISKILKVCSNCHVADIVLALRKVRGLYQLTVMFLMGEFVEIWLKNTYSSLLQGDSERHRRGYKS